MTDVMVTGRMSAEKKEQGNEILAKAGLNASQAINVLYDRLVAEKSADFLVQKPELSEQDWEAAAAFVDQFSSPVKTRFDKDCSDGARFDEARFDETRSGYSGAASKRSAQSVMCAKHARMAAKGLM